LSSHFDAIISWFRQLFHKYTPVINITQIRNWHQSYNGNSNQIVDLAVDGILGTDFLFHNMCSKNIVIYIDKAGSSTMKTVKPEAWFVWNDCLFYQISVEALTPYSYELLCQGFKP